MTGGKPAPESRHRLSRRRLTSDEEHLWSLVVRTVTPLRESKKPVRAMRHNGEIREGARPANKRAPVAPQGPASLRPASPAPKLVHLTRRERQQLVRDHAAIDARIDLHGMKQVEAHDALRQFLHRSQAKGAKFVLVITGKGAPGGWSGERGVLRRQVPLWLALPGFRRYVLGFDAADVGHGGEGALYVRLRRSRT